jgi:hypothetical protein
MHGKDGGDKEKRNHQQYLTMCGIWIKMHRVRKMLSNWNAPYIQSLMRLIETQGKVTLAHWAIDYSERVMLPLWFQYSPDDRRPQQALDAARAWLSGAIKLPEAKSAILDCHAAAREADNPIAQAAARSIGQSASAIHSAKHCIGLALYGALAVAYASLGTTASWKQLEPCAADECGRMLAALQAAVIVNEPHPNIVYSNDQ